VLRRLAAVGPWRMRMPRMRPWLPTPGALAATAPRRPRDTPAATIRTATQQQQQRRRGARRRCSRRSSHHNQQGPSLHACPGSTRGGAQNLASLGAMRWRRPHAPPAPCATIRNLPPLAQQGGLRMHQHGPGAFSTRRGVSPGRRAARACTRRMVLGTPCGGCRARSARRGAGRFAARTAVWALRFNGLGPLKPTAVVA